MTNKILILFGISPLFLFSPNAGKAQSFEQIKSQYPNEHAVMLNKSIHYTISVKDGLPYVLSDELEQFEYLTDDASRFMSQYGFFQSDFQQVVAYEAYTRTANDKKIKVNDFKTNDSKEDFVFYDDSKETMFDFPSIEKGATGNLKVSRINKNPYLLSPFYFASFIPVLNSELKISFPKDMIINYKLMGLDTSQVKIKMEKSHHENTYTFTYKDCPSIKRYGDAPGRPWYATQLIFYIASYTDENGKTIRYLSDLKDLYQLSYGYLKTINKTISPELSHIVDSLTFHINSPEEKARRIYNWVQGNIKYVAFEQGMEGFIPRDASLVCSRRFGDCKDMSSILTMMLKSAGIPAYFTWIGTRDLPYEFSNLPLPMVSNHMICTVLINGKYIFLDGTDPNCIFGFPSRAIQDKEAMLAIDENEYKIQRVPVIEKKYNVLVDSTWIELTASGLRGTIKRYLTGYFSMQQQGNLMYTRQKNLQKEMKENFSRGSNKFQLDSFRILPLTNPDSTTLLAAFSLPDYAKKLGDEWYLNLNLFKLYEHEEIDFPKRKMPIENNFLYQRKYITMMKIPEGYRTEYIPEGKSFHNEVWGFDLKYEKRGDWIVLTQEFDNDRMMLAPDQFEAWNKVLENLFPLYKETISLAKISSK